VWYPLYNEEVYASQDEKDKLINIYDGRIVYVDRQLKRIWDELVQLQLSEKTLFIVTSDHGEEFYDHEGIGHCTTLYDELVRVPLLLINKSLLRADENQRITRQVELIDLPATVLDFLGMRIPEQMEGTSLLESGINQSSDSEIPWALSYTSRGRKSLKTEEGRMLWKRKVWDHGVILESLRLGGEWKLIVGNDGQKELYDLRQDRGEQHNLAESEQARFEKFKEKLEEITDGLKMPVSEKKKGALSPETKEQLKALGYL
jgi:arylsulfatase A-like enzyme